MVTALLDAWQDQTKQDMKRRGKCLEMPTLYSLENCRGQRF